MFTPSVHMHTAPLFGAAPMIRSALQVTHEDSLMHVNLSGPALRGIIAAAVPMVSQMIGGAVGGVQPPDAGEDPIHTK